MFYLIFTLIRVTRYWSADTHLADSGDAW